ncbi:hypothetical protein GQ457_01G053820 [Hibiscus cannabinus]
MRLMEGEHIGNPGPGEFTMLELAELRWFKKRLTRMQRDRVPTQHGSLISQEPKSYMVGWEPKVSLRKDGFRLPATCVR